MCDDRRPRAPVTLAAVNSSSPKAVLGGSEYSGISDIVQLGATIFQEQFVHLRNRSSKSPPLFAASEDPRYEDGLQVKRRGLSIIALAGVGLARIGGYMQLFLSCDGPEPSVRIIIVNLIRPRDSDTISSLSHPISSCTMA